MAPVIFFAGLNRDLAIVGVLAFEGRDENCCCTLAGCRDELQRAAQIGHALLNAEQAESGSRARAPHRKMRIKTGEFYPPGNESGSPI